MSNKNLMDDQIWQGWALDKNSSPKVGDLRWFSRRDGSKILQQYKEIPYKEPVVTGVSPAGERVEFYKTPKFDWVDISTVSEDKPND